ncbi:MAG TPA: cytochrome P450 [Terracidiphilus sp.]|nr:cytochrome P450 [Terracidiphilus sp.]
MSAAISPNPVVPVLAGPVPHAKPLPYFQYLRTVRRNFIEALDESMYHAAIIRQGSAINRSFIVNDPAGVRRILLENPTNYPKARVEHRFLGPAMGNGLILSEGETWRAHRRIMAPAFDHRTIERYAPVMVDAARKLANRWCALPAGASVEMEDAMMELTLEIISRSMFAADSDGIKEIIREGSADYQEAMMPGLMEFVPGLGPVWSAWKGMRGRAIMRDFNRAMFALIETRMKNRADSADPDLLDRLIASRDEESGAGMTASEIRDQVLTIFVAGHETTALALMWTWYLLAMHPEHEARMYEEFDRVLGGREPVWADLAALSYTRMIVQESMRLYPAVYSLAFREAQQDDVLCGMRVPKGSLVTIIPWLIHRHRGYWQDADRFDPERFSPEASAGRDRLAYLPFGFGPRICLGAAFAMAEAVLVLATLAQRFRPRLVPGCRVEPQALFTLRAKYGMQMTIATR